eukprot:TRINITY_DN58478_c0_g1_i1.p1 TRINITY_DN58478_c0_g1~~TRINITY_DN58478_c0_g1_i1.p1  ORF type:complete len:210 (-),score=35.20 TRINITY_DN58478_c0_g1_i1:280-909(-)
MGCKQSVEEKRDIRKTPLPIRVDDDDEEKAPKALEVDSWEIENLDPQHPKVVIRASSQGILMGDSVNECQTTSEKNKGDTDAAPSSRPSLEFPPKAGGAGTPRPLSPKGDGTTSPRSTSPRPPSSPKVSQLPAQPQNLSATPVVFENKSDDLSSSPEGAVKKTSRALSTTDVVAVDADGEDGINYTSNNRCVLCIGASPCAATDRLPKV